MCVFNDILQKSGFSRACTACQENIAIRTVNEFGGNNSLVILFRHVSLNFWDDAIPFLQF
jgi:hypothetical protein